MLEDLMMPEVGVESFAQVLEIAPSQLATEKKSPGHTPRPLGYTALRTLQPEQLRIALLNPDP